MNCDREDAGRKKAKSAAKDDVLMTSAYLKSLGKDFQNQKFYGRCSVAPMTSSLFCTKWSSPHMLSMDFVPKLNTILINMVEIYFYHHKTGWEQQ